MYIQPVSINNYYNNNFIRSNKTISVKNSVTFCGNYSQVMDDVLCRDLICRADVEKAMSNLYKALLKEDGITKGEIQPILSEWLELKGTHLVEELCKPIAKVQSNLRDIIFKSEDENLYILNKGEDYLLYIMNLGKHGFWNSIFENQSATNNMKVVFMSKTGSFEVGTNVKGKLVSEQCHFSGPWTKNTYYMVCGDRITQETGNASDTVILPPI